MAETLRTVEQLQHYFLGVHERALHHAPEVSEVLFRLAGPVVLYKDEGTDLECGTYAGSLANVLTVRLGGTKYVFSYNHERRTIDMKQNNTRGPVVASLDNSTTQASVTKTVRDLAKQQ